MRGCFGASASMPSRLDTTLSEALAALESRALRRHLPAPGSETEGDVSSNDLLGLSRHPQVLAAAREALERSGAGGRAARLLGGGSPDHAAAEEAAASWLGAEAALLFASGYQANLGAVCALAGRGDAIVSDALNHASLVDATRLSRAHVLVAAHADAQAVRAALRRTRGARRRLVVTEGIFSMDGDAAPLADLAGICEEEDAWLLVDEAHAAGVIGPGGAGACAAAGIAGHERLAGRIVTGGKALGAGGAFAIGSRAFQETLLNRARPFIYSTAPPPPLAASLAAAIALARAAEGERARIRRLAHRLAAALSLPAPAAAIVPVPIGTSRAASAVASHLRERGFALHAVRPPTVPEGSSRLRIVVHANHCEALLDRLAKEVRGAIGRAARVSVEHPSRVEAAPLVFVIGTGTGIGKTVASAALLLAGTELPGASAASRPLYWKPVQTGEESDTATVARLTGAGSLPAPLVSLPLPASPHEAAHAAGIEICIEALTERLESLRSEAPHGLIVELAGGLLVPLTDEATQAEWLAAVAAPPARIVLVASSGLGTLNHTLLTLEALRARALEPACLVLAGPEHRSNRRTLERLSGVPVVVSLPQIEPLDGASLRRAPAIGQLRQVFLP